MLHLFNAMAALLKQPQMAFFKHFTQDFFEYDRRELLNWGSPEARYLWMVRSCGTHLVRLGISPKTNEHGMAALDGASGSRDEMRIFEVNAGSITEIDSAKARSLLGHGSYDYKLVDYTRDTETVLRKDKLSGDIEIASLRVTMEQRIAAMPLWHVRIQPERTLSSSDIGALRLIAQGTVSRHASSVLVGPASILINDRDIVDVMAEAVLKDEPVEDPVKVRWLDSSCATGQGELALAA